MIGFAAAAAAAAAAVASPHLSQQKLIGRLTDCFIGQSKTFLYT